MTSEVRKLHQPETRGTWVQTERAAHEAWAHLISHSPRAAALMHILVANMDERSALVVSQQTLAKLQGVSLATIKRAISELIEKQWIQTIRIGGERGGALAYVVNSRIAWADSRENLKMARFSARVLVSSADQENLGEGDLKQIPALSPGDQQLPHGEPGPLPEPPAQSMLPTMDQPDLPGLTRD